MGTDIYIFLTIYKLSLMDNMPLWAPLHIDDAVEACIAATKRESKCSITLNVGTITPKVGHSIAQV